MKVAIRTIFLLTLLAVPLISACGNTSDFVSVYADDNQPETSTSVESKLEKRIAELERRLGISSPWP